MRTKYRLIKTVTFIELPDGDEEEYTISAEAESNSGEKSLMILQIAQALIGKLVNDEVTIATPGGDMLVKITKVEQA